MGQRLSSRNKRGADNGAAPEPEGASAVAAAAATATAAVQRLSLNVNPDGECIIAPLADSFPQPTISEDDLLVRVQLQASFSPNQAIHLILLPSSLRAQGELSHSVGDWLGTPRKEGLEAAHVIEEAQVMAQRSRSPCARLASKLSPRQKAGSLQPQW